MKQTYEAGMHVRYGGTGICLIDRMLEEAVLDTPLAWIEDRKQRSAEYKRILAGGDAPTLLRMIHGILRQKVILKAEGRRLTAMDDNARKDAARMLDEEFGFSLGMKPEEASRYIYDRLNRE